MPCPEELFQGEPLSYWLADQKKDYRGQPRQEVDLAAELLAAQRSPLVTGAPVEKPPRPQDYEVVGDLLTDLVAVYSRWGRDPLRDDVMWEVAEAMRRLSELL